MLPNDLRQFRLVVIINNNALTHIYKFDISYVLSCPVDIKNKKCLPPGQFQSGYSQVPRSIPPRMPAFCHRSSDPQTLTSKVGNDHYKYVNC